MANTKEVADQIDRLQYTVRKLASWLGYDISELIENEFIVEGDLDEPKVVEWESYGGTGRGDERYRIKQS